MKENSDSILIIVAWLSSDYFILLPKKQISYRTHNSESGELPDSYIVIIGLDVCR